MNMNRIWTLSCVVLIGAILAGGYFVGISPLLSAAAVADADRIDVEQQNLRYTTDLATLKQDFSQIEARRAELATAQAVVPSDAEDEQFIGELHELQESSGATITSFTVSDPKAYAPVVTELPVEPAAPVEGAEATADGATAATTTADTTPAAVSTPAVEGAELMTAESFTAIPYSVSVAGTLEQTEAYVAGLQSGSRLFLVTKLALQYDETSGSFTHDIDGYIWVYRASDGTAEQTSPTTGATVTAN